jgi:hypothetical protein
MVRLQKSPNRPFFASGDRRSRRDGEMGGGYNPRFGIALDLTHQPNAKADD